MSDQPSHQSEQPANQGGPPAPQAGATNSSPGTGAAAGGKGNRLYLLLGVTAAVALATFGVTLLLVSIFEHRQEARQPFVRLVEVDETTTDPAVWGINWPDQFDTYLRTVDSEETEFGGSSTLPDSKLEEHPWLKRLFAGYAFSIDYREARGHAYMLHDQEVTRRVTERSQSGACLEHRHAAVIPTYRRLGLEAQGEPADAAALGASFNWPAVMEGFKLASAMDYEAAHAELSNTPDGTPVPEGSAVDLSDPAVLYDPQTAHPVSCVDCHDPESMQVRVTRPGFVEGIAALAASDASIPPAPSIDRWREGNRQTPYDPNALASRQEMRTFVCAQCHVEYYCASKETLFFPWENGLKVEEIEKTYDEHLFPDGTEFFDWKHEETGAAVYKAQHPEFELWSQGIHARSGVSCADCHMPYERMGAMKVSSHWVRSPLLNINRACQTCHNAPEAELRGRVEMIQARTSDLVERAASAMTDMLDAINAAQAAGVSEEQLAPVLELQRKGMWRLDFISSENSKGFHADQEAARILGESIDYSRQAEIMAVRLLAGQGAAAPAGDGEENTEAEDAATESAGDGDAGTGENAAGGDPP